MQSEGISLREISRLEAARMEEKLRENSPSKNGMDKAGLRDRPLAPILFMILAFVMMSGVRRGEAKVTETAAGV